MSKYVKFMRGTPEAYARLAVKEEDVLYFISAPDSNESHLYLGSKQITCDSNSELTAIALSDLIDVNLIDPLIQDSILAYDVASEKWIAKNIEDLILSMPEIEVNSAQVFQVVLNENETHEAAIIRAIGSNVVTNGDFVIIKELIANDKYQYVTYVKTDIEWTPMSDNYSASKVYFSDDLSTITTNGQNLVQVLETILATTANIIADDDSIVLNNEKLSLRNYGMQYYKYIAASGSEAEGNYIAPHYELQIVDDTHPWIAGLEPRVASEEGNLVLAWYEPYPITLDELSTQVISIQDVLHNLQEAAEELASNLSAVETSVVELNQSVTNLQTGLNNVYTKEESDTLIQQAVANSQHLKYKIVDYYDDIDPSVSGADQYIYLVPRANGTYDEYMIINGNIEKVGDWNTDLSDYVTKTELVTELNKKVNVVEGSRLMTEVEGNKLATIEEGAQKNLFETISGDFSIDENGQLNLMSIGVSQVTDLESLLNTKADTVALDTITVELKELDSKVINLESALNSYVPIDTYTAEMAELRDCLTWKELE